MTLPLDGLSVLIGDNGSGKSSILEVLEILRATTHENFVGRLSSLHGGVHQIREHGALETQISATIDVGQPELVHYVLGWGNGSSIPTDGIAWAGTGALSERIVAARDAATGAAVTQTGSFPVARSETVAFVGASHDPIIAAVVSALRGIEVHLPFQVAASWASQDRKSPRGVALVEPTRQLERFGTNVVNAYQALKNDFGIDHWNETLEYLHLGLGHKVRDVRLEAIPGGGHMALALEIEAQGRVPAFSLADGVLSYLAFVALFRLDEGRTLLAFDEPELHLHPGLLMRVLGLFETMSDRYPVVIATHSDRLLDGLSDPVASVVVTELDDLSRTRLRRLDTAALSDWMTDYRGLGDLRADGELRSVLAEVDSSGDRDIKEQDHSP